MSRSASAGSQPGRLHGTLKQRFDISSCLFSNPTRGRAQFHTSMTARSGSPGIFSTFKHYDGEVTKKKEEPYSRSQSQRSNKSVNGQDGSIHRFPFRCTSSNPKVFERDFSYQSVSRSTEKENSQQRGRSKEIQIPAVSREANSTQRKLHDVDPMATIAALLRRDLTKKSNEQKRVEEVHQRVRQAIAVRYNDIRSADTTQKSMTMVPAKHEGLRVEYYDHCRKLKAPSLAQYPSLSLEEKLLADRTMEGANSKIGKTNLTRTEIRSILEFCSEPSKLLMVNKEFASCVLSQQRHGTQQKLWKELQEAEKAVRDIPASFFEALMTLGTDPPRRVLFVFHLIILIVEPHCTVVPLPQQIVWRIAQDLLLEKDFIAKMLHTKLQSVNPQRVLVLKDVMRSECLEAGLGYIELEKGKEVERSLSLSEIMFRLKAHIKEQNVHAHKLFHWVTCFVNIYDTVIACNEE